MPQPGNTPSRNTQAYLPGDFELHTHYAVVTAAEEDECKGEAVQGVIGTSPITSVIDLVDSVPVDYVHTVSEGVTRTLLNGGAPFFKCSPCIR